MNSDLVKGLGFNLPDSLAGYPEFFSNLLKCVGYPILKTKANF